MTGIPLARTSLIAALAALLLFASHGAAHAGALGAAKGAGWVGERYDGYLGLVRSGAPADIAALVEDINQKRAVHYGKIAKKDGTAVKAVAAIAGAKLLERAKPGDHVMRQEGGWERVGD